MDSTMPYAKQPPSRHDAGECAPVPEFRRNQFVYGQLMGVADFRAEQSYFREKLRLTNRCMHGWYIRPTTRATARRMAARPRPSRTS